MIGRVQLEPPGSFPLSADPAFQDEVRRELECVIARVRDCAAARSVAGVLLTGSFARGEGTVIPNPESKSRWLSDVECLVWFETASFQARRFTSRCGRSSTTPTPIASTRIVHQG